MERRTRGAGGNVHGAGVGGRGRLAGMLTMRAMRRAVVLSTVMLACGLPAAWAQDWARAALEKSPRHREYVAVKTAAGRSVNTFVVYPETSGKAPVVVLVHEIFGLTDWAKLMADELAAKGYVVLVPDLLSGTGTGPGGAPPTPAGGGTHMDHDMSAMGSSTQGKGSAATGGTDAYPTVDAVVQAVSGLPPEQVMGDLDAVTDYAERKIPVVTGKVSVAGFCWGGGTTFAFATHRKGLLGSYVFYGPTPAAGLEGISAPVYGFYAQNDARITAGLAGTMTAMRAAGKAFDPITYPGAGHGFMRAGQAPDATAENRRAWQEGFERMLGELGRGR